MKEGKQFYKSFEFKGRMITLCALITKSKNFEVENPNNNDFTSYGEISFISFGYSVCVTDDEYDKELGKTISLGRANKYANNPDTEDKYPMKDAVIDSDYLSSNLVDTLLESVKFKIINGIINIKGIK